jgi:hypothetical protein
LPVPWPTQEQLKPFLLYKGKSLNDLLEGMKLLDIKSESPEEQVTSRLRFFSLCKGCGIDRIHFLTLPTLTEETDRVWWKNAIEKMIETKFSTLLRLPHWEKELNGVSTGTAKDKLHELKKYCVSKVKQFAQVKLAHDSVAHRQRR